MAGGGGARDTLCRALLLTHTWGCPDEYIWHDYSFVAAVFSHFKFIAGIR